jgi:hypothetical protein
MNKPSDRFDPAEYERQASERWGESEAFRISTERVKTYTDEDWQMIRDESEAIYTDLNTLLTAGESADCDAAMAVAERHRLSIDRWFYPCSPAMHAGLADTYETDRRFSENIDKFGAGLTPFLVAAIRANSARQSGS